MKNFPEHNSFKELGKRLEKYTEQPDDLVWSNIDAALRPRRTPLWFTWVDGISTATIIILFTLVWNIKVNRVSPLLTHAPESFKPNRIEKELPRVPQQDITDEFTNEKARQKTAIPITKKSRFLKSNSETQITPFAGGEIYNRAFFDTVASNYPIKSQFPLENKVTDTIFIDLLTSKMDSFKTQEVAPKKRKRLGHGLTFYFNVTPQLSFQHVIPVSQDGVVITDIYNQPIFSSERLGINLEVGIQGKLARKLEYYGGLSVFQQHQTLKYEYQTTSDLNIESVDDLNYTITPESRTGVINYAMLNMGANAGLLYHLRGKNLAHKVGVGLSYQYGSRKIASEVYDNSSSQYLFYQLFYRNELQLNTRLKFFIQPTFSQSIFVNQKLEAPFKVKPYRTGLGLGLLYRL
ncbi:MAG TPA: hypothetical protein VJ184_02305 [Chryseolinea sp.]|nr:hypothetical protein [Chryseolinea sp.]